MPRLGAGAVVCFGAREAAESAMRIGNVLDDPIQRECDAAVG
jgi:hypothetical protein